MVKLGASVLVLSLFLAVAVGEEKRDILNDVGTLAGKLVGKAWRTVMPGDIVKGSIVGAQDQQYHGQPQGGAWGGIPPPYPYPAPYPYPSPYPAPYPYPAAPPPQLPPQYVYDPPVVVQA